VVSFIRRPITKNTERLRMILNVARAKPSFSFQSLIITTSSDEMVKLGHSET